MELNYRYSKITKTNPETGRVFTAIRVTPVDENNTYIDGEKSFLCVDAKSNAEAKAMIMSQGKTTLAAETNDQYPNSVLISYGVVERADFSTVKTVTAMDRLKELNAVKADAKAKLEKVLNKK